MATDSRALVFLGAGQPLQQQAVPVPDQLQPGEILVAITLATICGSDVHTIEGRRTEPTPAILGHEGVGTIAAMGPGVEKPLGERVTWTIADSCGHCAFCTDYDLPEKCDDLFKYGHAALHDGHGLHGTYASHVVLRAGTSVFAIPDELPDAVVAPANCALATAVNVVEQVPQPAASVLVQGGGLLGLYACALLREAGVSQVLCSDPVAERRQLAQRFGAVAVEPGAVEETVDAVVELSGALPALSEGLQRVRTGGAYVWAGMVHPDSDLQGITAEQVIRKCLTIRGVHNYSPRHLRAGLDFLQATVDRYPFEDLVSPPLALGDFEEALQQAQQLRWPRVALRP